jgi:hypothetical protein
VCRDTGGAAHSDRAYRAPLARRDRQHVRSPDPEPEADPGAGAFALRIPVRDRALGGRGKAIEAAIDEVTDLPITAILYCHKRADQIAGTAVLIAANPGVLYTLDMPKARLSGDDLFGARLTETDIRACRPICSGRRSGRACAKP